MRGTIAMKTVVITVASSGLGKTLAADLAAQGHTVYDPDSKMPGAFYTMLCLMADMCAGVVPQHPPMILAPAAISAGTRAAMSAGVSG